MSDCTFCDIIAGRRPAAFAYRDERAVVIMDHLPVNPGHALVIPVHHVELLPDLDEEIGTHLFRIGMRIDRAIRESGLRADGIRLALADGRAAGQVVPHVHLHVIPRIRGDHDGGRRSASPAELQRTAGAIERAYGRLFGEGGA